MKTVSMSGSPRENVGKKDAKMHRRLGKVPCVLYGGKEQVHFTTDEKAFMKLIFTPHVYIIDLKIEGKEYKAVLQDVQYHPVTDKVLHVDFLEVYENKSVVIALPVMIEGTSTGVLQGGRLIFKLRKLKVKALMEHLPDNIVIDITKLKIGDTIRVADIKRDNIEFLDAPNSVVVGVRVTRVVEEIVSEEGEEEEGGEKAESGGEPEQTQE